jgi:hypothetical protein
LLQKLRKITKNYEKLRKITKNHEKSRTSRKISRYGKCKIIQIFLYCYKIAFFSAEARKMEEMWRRHISEKIRQRGKKKGEEEERERGGTQED